MIELRTFRNTDKAAPTALKFLTLAVAPGGFAVQFYGPKQAATRTAAEEWMAAERAKSEAARLRTTTKPRKTDAEAL